MSFILGDTTLPEPVEFRREYIELSAENETLKGETKRKVENRKERFTLEFKGLAQSQVSEIIAEYNLRMIRDFSVSEDNLSITSTPVHIDIASRDYNNKTSDYREDITLYLTEVS